MKMNIVSRSGKVPEYETPGSAGFDVSACIDKQVILKPGERALIPTGLFFEVPVGYEAQVRARSGLAVKHGIGLVNGVGTVDSDYRGEVKIAIINLGSEDFAINDGDRIAQVVIAPYVQVDIERVEQLSETDRGEGGFGHTGI